MPKRFFLLTLVALTGWSLMGCYALEMQLEDPLYSYREERTKTGVFLPLFATTEVSQTSQVLFEKTLKAEMAELSSLKIKSPSVLPVELRQSSRKWFESQSQPNFNKLAELSDLVITGSLTFNYYRGAAPNQNPLTLKEIQAVGNFGAYLELNWRVQFWDTETRRLIFEHQDTLGDMTFIAERQKLEQQLIQRAVGNLRYRLNPYFVYR